MNKASGITALYTQLAERIADITDEELLDEIRENGQDPKAIAQRARTVLQRIQKEIGQEKLRQAKDRYLEETQRLEEGDRGLIPADSDSRRALFLSVMAAQPSVGELTLQYRNLDELTDEDIETALLALVRLGVIK